MLFSISCNKAFTYILACIFFTVSLVPLSADAAEKKDSKQREARRSAQMKQQFEEEKAQMQTQFQTEKSALEEKLKHDEKESSDLKSSFSEAKGKLASANFKLASLQKENTDLLASKQKLETDLNETQNKLKDTQAKLAEVTEQYQQSQHDLALDEIQRKDLSVKLQKRSDDVASCEDKNTKMYSVTSDLIQTCEHPSVFQKILKSEPFTQLKRVGLENTLQDYRDKLDDQKIITSTK